MEPEMKWERLKDKKCPKCGGRLVDEQYGYYCSNGNIGIPCLFKISHARFNSVVESLYKKSSPRRFRYVSEEENLQGLNSL